jgi:type IV pilus assembly protein PilE
MKQAGRFGRSPSKGFTLVELIITLIVVSVLLAVALPTFLDSIRKGRRSEAFTALSAIQQAQERWRSNRPTYGTLVELGIAASSRPSGYYALSVSGASATGYTIVADGSSSSQRGDGSCAILGMRVAAGALSYASCASCSVASLSYTATNACWAR